MIRQLLRDIIGGALITAVAFIIFIAIAGIDWSAPANHSIHYKTSNLPCRTPINHAHLVML